MTLAGEYISRGGGLLSGVHIDIHLGIFHGFALFPAEAYKFLLLRAYHLVNCRKADSRRRENARGFGIFVPIYIYLRRLLLHGQLTHAAVHLQ